MHVKESQRNTRHMTSSTTVKQQQNNSKNNIPGTKSEVR